MSLAKLETLEFIVSNTTESGIVLDRNDNFEGLPSTYPGKLTKFLYERFNAFGGAKDKGLIILPTELIEENGKKLKECVLALADIWDLPTAFKIWLEESNVFCSTLVDRIVAGYPSDSIDTLCKELGYEDKLVDIGEPFALWVIESEKDISEALPLDKIGLPVIFTDNHKPYKERKVRVLNGAHTSSVLFGYLYGFDIVRDCMHDPIMGEFIRRVVMDEIVPQVNLPLEEVQTFAASVFERFENPYIKHALLSISLNSTSKWKSRCMPSLIGYIEKTGEIPSHLAFSLAALMSFYTGSELRDSALIGHRNGEEYKILDDAAALEFFAAHSAEDSVSFTKAYLSNTAFFGRDLTEFTGLAEKVAGYVDDIRTFGMREAIKKVNA
jgi:tagaturonate reductase